MSNSLDYFLTSDGSIVSQNGKVLFFSVARFRRDICEGDCCFICGALRNETKFNDEHVIPEWILREFDLFSKVITLPNGATYQYDRYKIPCCSRCNSMLGAKIELPVSEILKGGIKGVTKHLRSKGPWLLFIWMSLIFLKTHLRDWNFRWHLDKRQGISPISEAYDCAELHHIHTIARAFFTKPELNEKVMGTFFICPATQYDQFEEFDYGDLYLSRTIFIRFRDAAMVCVLNDSCGCFSLEKDKLFARIKGSLSPLQIREIAARVAYLNLLIKNRPLFHSEFTEGDYVISGIHPDVVELNKWDPEEYGRILNLLCESYIESGKNADIETVKELVRKGRYTFLFDENGEFIKKQVYFSPSREA